ncbi:MAG: helix-hairpin-helix domain-containing protein [Bacteroidetes bacterium]|nr:helix-hairpin-helix domain-containing protein [Bacteroidota bacterium]
MRNRLRDYFSFTDSERKGTVVLLLLVLVLVIYSFAKNKFSDPAGKEIAISEKWIPATDSTIAKNNLPDEKDDREQILVQDASPHSLYRQHELFNFDPNTIAEDDWVRLGLSPAQARVIKKYQSKGGTFRTKDDLKKMFVISGKFYNEIESYILLPEKNNSVAQNSSSTPFVSPPKKEKRIIELNTADSSDLVSVNGIGPAFAKRILEYRNRLGGFHSNEQLMEVYGIDAEKYSTLKDQVKTDSTYIRKININTAEISELRKHPYFSPAIAAALVNYRKQHGPFKNISDIRKCALVSDDLYRKIAPYLSL